MYRSYLSSVLIAVIAPWLLAYEFLRTASWQRRRWLVTIFFSVFGSVALLGTGDGFVHLEAVRNEYASMSLAEFTKELWQIVTFQLTESGSKDVYKHVLSYLFGGILNTPQLFFPIVATVYGYFFSGAVLEVLRNFRISQTNYVILSFVIIFLFVRGLEGFYTVRTWTGMWILVYACLKYFETRRLRYAILMFVPPLVHVGFFVLAIPAWIVLAFGSRPLLYASILIASSVTTILPAQDAASVLSATERGQAQVNAYRVEERQVALEEYDRIKTGTNWYNAYRRAGLQRWAPTLLIFTLLLSGIYLRGMNTLQKDIFSIGLLTMAMSNSTWFLFAVHNRSLTIAIVFLLAGFLMARLDPRTRSNFVSLPEYYRWGLHLSIVLFAPLILFHMSMTLDWMSVFMFGFPFVVWLDPDVNMSVKEFLRVLLTAG